MIRVQQEDFDVGAELAALAPGSRTAGAVASFTGIVRDTGTGGPVRAMTLEHYPGMTESQLAAIEAEARRRWPLEDVRIVHRVGRLAPGDRIVLVACASAHRAAAFEACMFLTDRLKTRAPFWKMEDGESGARWVAARAGDEAAAARWEPAGGG